jgi:hypothetical protein
MKQHVIPARVRFVTRLAANHAAQVGRSERIASAAI